MLVKLTPYLVPDFYASEIAVVNARHCLVLKNSLLQQLKVTFVVLPCSLTPLTLALCQEDSDSSMTCSLTRGSLSSAGVARKF